MFLVPPPATSLSEGTSLHPYLGHIFKAIPSLAKSANPLPDDLPFPFDVLFFRWRFGLSLKTDVRAPPYRFPPSRRGNTRLNSLFFFALPDFLFFLNWYPQFLGGSPADVLGVCIRQFFDSVDGFPETVLSRVSLFQDSLFFGVRYPSLLPVQ